MSEVFTEKILLFKIMNLFLNLYTLCKEETKRIMTISVEATQEKATVSKLLPKIYLGQKGKTTSNDTAIGTQEVIKRTRWDS